MVPHIFISSTVADLQYLRDALRDTVAELGFQPVMSEHGEVGFLPTESAETSCYAAVRDCHIAIVILGKRYGSRGLDGRSITHNEYLTARDSGVPVFCLVDNEVLTSKKMFDANPEMAAALRVPGFEDPKQVFALVDEVASAPRNNAVIAFDSVPSARSKLRTQLALLFGDLLRRNFDPVQAEVRDVLSEVRALRHELTSTSSLQTRKLVRAIRLLLEERFKPLRELLEQLPGGFENSALAAQKAGTFSDAIQEATGAKLEVEELPPPGTNLPEWMADQRGIFKWSSVRTVHADGEAVELSLVAVSKANRVVVNHSGEKYFGGIHSRFRAELDGEALTPAFQGASRGAGLPASRLGHKPPTPGASRAPR